MRLDWVARPCTRRRMSATSFCSGRTARRFSSENGWPPEKIDAAIASGETQTVPLHRPVPVRLVYLTAYPAAGGIAFAPDIYGWDARLLQLLDSSAGQVGSRA